MILESAAPSRCDESLSSSWTARQAPRDSFRLMPLVPLLPDAITSTGPRGHETYNRELRLGVSVLRVMHWCMSSDHD